MSQEQRIQELEQENAQLREQVNRQQKQLQQIDELEAVIHQLEERIQELEERLAKNSHNSSKPPSSDGFKRRKYSQRKPSSRPTGGQPGHEGQTLRRSETPDAILIHRPKICQECQADLQKSAGEISETRQVMDIPPPATLIVTEHRVVRVHCPQCGKQSTGVFPEEVKAEVQYGPELRSLAVYLYHYHHISLERTCEALEDLVGVHISEGTVQVWVEEAARRAEPIVEQIVERIKASPHMGGDETGIRIAGKLHWMHVASTKWVTHLAWHQKRGRAAMDAMGIWTEYSGKAMHDRLMSYEKYPCVHRLCKAHLIRDLTYLEEVKKLAWAGSMRELLVEMHHAAKEWLAKGVLQIPEDERKGWITHYFALILLGYQQIPPLLETSTPHKGKKKQHPAKLLLDVLSVRAEQVIGFVDDTAEDFTNNQREQDLRMVKVKEKVSGGFRSEAGATAFCALRSVVSTFRKQSHRAFAIIRSLFHRDPIPFALSLD